MFSLSKFNLLFLKRLGNVFDCFFQIYLKLFLLWKGENREKKSSKKVSWKFSRFAEGGSGGIYLLRKYKKNKKKIFNPHKWCKRVLQFISYQCLSVNFCKSMIIYRQKCWMEYGRCKFILHLNNKRRNISVALSYFPFIHIVLLERWRGTERIRDLFRIVPFYRFCAGKAYPNILQF